MEGQGRIMSGCKTHSSFYTNHAVITTIQETP